MSRRPLLLLAGLGLAVTVGVGVWAAAGPHPHGTAAAPPQPGAQPTTSSTPPDPGTAVRWAPGPWGPAKLAGRPLLLPASPTEGPLVDHGNGWASGYRPSPLAAAIALLRAGPSLAGAPPALHAQVEADTLTDIADTAALIGPIRNQEPAWTLPAALLAAGAGSRVRLLGVVVDADDTQARATVYQAVAGPGGDTITATGYDLVHGSGQWRVQAAGATTVVAGAPGRYTLPTPSED